MKNHKNHNQEGNGLLPELAEQSPIGICIVQKRCVVYQNPVYKHLLNGCLGLLENEALSGIHPNDTGSVKNMVDRVISGISQFEETEFRLRRDSKNADRNIKWVHCLISTYRHQGQRAIMINAVDITRTKESEKISNLIDKMNFLDQIASDIAHEIRNPLTAINNYLFVLNANARSVSSEDHNEQSIQDLMPKIQIASDRIESVIKRIMEFSKITTTEMVSTNMNQVLEKVIEFTVDIIGQHNIKIEKSFARNISNIYADQRLIQQALLNILATAFDAMLEYKGSKIIEIETLARQNMVFINISNSSSGVSPEARGQIFNPFLTDNVDKVGVGLLVKKIIALHCGFIEAVDSKLKGLEMRICLPIDKMLVKRNIPD